MEKTRTSFAGPLILAGLALLAAVIGIVAYMMATTKTTIRITKGRPGASTTWNVSVDGSETRLAPDVPVSGTLWRKMNGTVESFRKVGCDGKETSVMELRYQTGATAGELNDVLLQGTIGATPTWDFSECGVTMAPCTFPGRYFDPTYYKAGEEPCADPAASESWTLVLR